MGIQSLGRNYRKVTLFLTIIHGVILVFHALLRDWLDLLPWMRQLLPHYVFFASIPILCALLLWTKYGRTGALLIMLCTIIFFIYFPIFRFLILPPLIPRITNTILLIVFEIAYWGTIVLNVPIFIFALRAFNVYASIGADNKSPHS